jgi:hypothetical protein
VVTSGSVTDLWPYQLARGQSNAKSEDVTKVKKAIASWQMWDPPLDPDDKSSRGLNHVQTAGLLAPLSVKWENEE